MNKKILFTGGGGAGNEAIWRLLKDKYDLYFADSELDNIDAIIPVENKFLIPYAYENNFIADLVLLSNKLGLDYIVPGVDEELLKFSKDRKLFSCEILLPNHEFIESTLDKYNFAKSVKLKGLTAPSTYHINKWYKLNFPMIVKPTTGRGSRGVMVVKNEAELNAYKVFNPIPDDKLIAQALVEGEEFTVFVSANKYGALNSIIPVKVEQKRGVTISAVTENNEYIIDYVKSFHEIFSTIGIYNLQCILTSDNKIFPFEVNPRISTTFCMSLAAGFDPFESFNKETKDLFKPEKDVRLKRNWKNTISN